MNQAIEFDTDPIKLSNENEAYLKPLVDSNIKLKEKLKEIKRDMENVNTQIQTVLSDIEKATTSDTPIQSINDLHDSFEKVSETSGSLSSVFTNTQNIFLVYTKIGLLQITWESQFNSSMRSVAAGVFLCCLLSIVLIVLVLKPKRFSLKKFYDKNSSE